jgi:hypothetical protein
LSAEGLNIQSLEGGHEEDSDGSRLIPLRVSEACSTENLPGLFTMLLKGVTEEGCEFIASLLFVLVVLLRFVI